MKPQLTVQKVYEDKITEYDFPVYISGYDPYSNQEFKGDFVYRIGLLEPISYTTTKNKKLSKHFIIWAIASIKRFKEERHQ